ncbi:hypothetical protein YC2023_065676 [Brassica napus]
MWRCGDYGRLGLGSLESQWTPSVCSALSDHSIRALSCSRAHTLFLTGDPLRLKSRFYWHRLSQTRRVFATGLNDCGQLGVSDVNTHALEPLEVSGIENDILHISAGYNHSAAVTEHGIMLMREWFGNGLRDGSNGL